jgi:hypothetical protein
VLVGGVRVGGKGEDRGLFTPDFQSANATLVISPGDRQITCI